MPATILIVSDVDNTLLGEGAAIDAFSDWVAERADRVRLVYASGRFFPSVVESVKRHRLPLPDAIIGGVGTEIQLYPDGVELEEWSREQCHHWNPAEIRERLCDLPFLSPQPEEFQSRFKISYFLHDATEAQLADVKEALSDNWLRTELIYSSRRDLDIVPAGVNKGSAAAFLASVWKFAPERVVVCGDSGNDLPMFARGFRGVIVGNAHDDLKAAAGPQNYLSASTHAAGVVEGLDYWTGLLETAAPRIEATVAVA